MSSLRVEIDRLNITLDGFTGVAGADAMRGIERELRRAIDDSLWPGGGPPDVAALRAAIVERIAEAIRHNADDNGSEAF